MKFFVTNASDDDHRRPVPEGSGAFVCLGYSWEDMVKAAYEDFLRSAPELRRRNVIWLLRARVNGFRVEFFDDDEAMLKRLQAEEAAGRVPGVNGPQVHAGRITWL